MLLEDACFLKGALGIGVIETRSIGFNWDMQLLMGDQHRNLVAVFLKCNLMLKGISSSELTNTRLCMQR